MTKKPFFALALSVVLLTGCGVRGPSSSPTASESRSASPVGPNVQVDWSVLGNQEDPLPAVGSRWYPEYMDHLIPRSDYGTLVPFSGALAYFVTPEDDSSYSVPLYGMMTEGGTIVMDAICDSIFSVSYDADEAAHTSVIRCLPVFQLHKGDPTNGNPYNNQTVALAAQDGSWCTDFVYWGCFGFPGGVAAGNGERLSLLDAQTGAVTKSWTWAELGIDDPYQFPWFTGDAYETAQWTGEQFFLGTWGDNCDTARLLNPKTGAVTTQPSQEWYASCEKRFGSTIYWNSSTDEDGMVTLTLGEQRYTFQSPLTQDASPYVIGADRVVFDPWSDSPSFAVTDLNGSVILPSQGGILTVLGGGEDEPLLFAARPTGTTDWLVYSRDGVLLSTLPSPSGTWCNLSGPLAEVGNETTAAYYQPETGTCVLRVYLSLNH
ncbi:MAG: hypothetical protein AB7E30_11485 [Lawsonibacter sp.]